MIRSADYVPYDFRAPYISIYGTLTDRNRFGKKTSYFRNGVFRWAGVGGRGLKNCDPTFSGGQSKPGTAKHDV